jgi:hypothetical protein
MSWKPFCDTSGQPSRTLIMCYSSLCALLGKFLLSGLQIGTWHFPVVTAGEFGLAATGIIGAWVAREYKRKELAARQ